MTLFKSTNHYWFYLEPYVYVRIKNNDLLIYNTLSGSIRMYTDVPKMVALLMKLKNKTNLFAIDLSGQEIETNGITDIIDQLRDDFSCDLVDTSVTVKKPFLRPPCWDVQVEAEPTSGDVPTVRKKTFLNASPESFLSLNQLTFFLNGKCNAQCLECRSAYKQLPWCTATDTQFQLPADTIKSILHQTSPCALKRINLLGGDLSTYTQLSQLITCLDNINIPIHCHINFHHLETNSEWLRSIPRSWHIQLLVHSNLLGCDTNLEKINNLLHPNLHSNVHIVFLIDEEQSFPLLEKAIDQLKLSDFSVQPFFNGSNFNFFKENVFTTIESLSEEVLDLDTIRSRSSVNPLSYGKLIINQNGDIFSNINALSLGNIEELSISEAVVHELTQQGNWLQVRRNVTPCNNCLLDAICPPISNFESATGIFNSCNIFK